MKKLLVAAVLFLSACAGSDVRQTTHRVTASNGYCSAVALRPGVMLTAQHCAAGAEDALTAAAGKATVIAQGDDKLDIALLRFARADCPCAELADSEAKPDETVYIVGYPYNLTQTVTTGTSQGVVADIKLPGPWGTTDELGRRLVITNAAVAPGNSGGGVYVRRGGRFLLVGILTEGKGPISFAVPLADIKAFLATHLEYQHGR